MGCSDENYATISETGVFPNSYQISGLEPGNKYRVRVRLSNVVRYGTFSNSIIATTLETGESVESIPVLMVIALQLPVLVQPHSHCHFQ